MRESRLLAHIYAADDAADDARPGRVLLGPGDDLAAVEGPPGPLVTGVDQVVAGRHVRWPGTPLADIGRKAVLRSLSDIAAMAARPLCSLAAVVLPSGMRESEATELFDAARLAASAWDAPLVGGDIAVHATADHPLTLSVTVLGSAGPAGVVTRSGARPGDVVYVTGRIGATFDADGGGHHLTFAPRIPEALELAATLGDRLHSMMDVSDGLGLDASRLAVASGVWIEIEGPAIPCRGDRAWSAAAADGEDYELLFTAAGPVPDRLGSTPVTPIGHVQAAAPDGPGATLGDASVRLDGATLGWEHAGSAADAEADRDAAGESDRETDRETDRHRRDHEGPTA